MAAKPFPSGHDLAAADVNDLTGVYDRAAAEIDLTNTVTETAIYSKSIGASHMSSDRLLRLTLMGDLLFNNGGSNGLTLRVKFGATTMIAGGLTPVADADRGAWEMTVLLANRGATNVQRCVAWWAVGDRSAAVSGIGSWTTIYFAPAPMRGTAAEDTTAAKTLEVTAQWTSASTNLSLRRDYGILELL